LDALIVLGIIGTAEEAVRRIVGRPLVRTYRKFERFLDAWNGEPERDGLPARPGIVERVIAIEYQVHNNGGGSMKDSVDKGVKVAQETKAALDEHVRQSALLLEQGAADKAAIEARQDKTDRTIATLAEAVKIAAQSTPPEEHE
jgi:hypothetical protein